MKKIKNKQCKINKSSSNLKKQKNKGITLIALVITIIVLLILAGVTIAMLTGENGILKQAESAKENTELSEEEEKSKLDQLGATIENYEIKDQSGANTPILKTGMKKVYWEGTQEIKEDDENFDNSKWYNYSENRWANAYTEDGSYWVWIPRFEYKVTNEVTDPANAGTVDLNFISTDIDEDSEATQGYTIHPAFRNGTKNNYENGEWKSEISGFWVAKYEMSMEENGVHKETSNEEIGNIGLSDTIKMVSKPNVSSWRCINIANAYTNSYNYDREKESHLIKNSEWGAIAFLTHSKYGRNGEEIAINNSSSYITGSSAGKAGANTTDPVYAYNTGEGQKASTTGNMSGIYDMSGGAWERVAVFNGAYTGEYFTGTNYIDTNGKHFASTDGTSTLYATEYNNPTNTNYENFNIGKVSVIGDAIQEVYIGIDKGWNNDYSYFMYIGSPFFIRGGDCSYTNYAGVFCSSNSSGIAYGSHSFRVILI